LKHVNVSNAANCFQTAKSPGKSNTFTSQRTTGQRMS